MHLPTVILLSDGDPAFLTTLQTQLSAAGYPIAIIVKSEDIYPLLYQVVPNILILDIEPQHQTGWQNLVAIKGNPLSADIPLIVCSSDLQAFQERARLLRLGSCEFLEKPFSRNNVLRAIERLLPSPELF